MIERLIRVSLARPLFVFIALLLFIGAGVYAFSNLPIEAFPDVTDTQTTVIALYPGHAAEEVEQQVTVPLEIALAGMPHAVQMFSHTQQGLSYVVITFDDAASDYFARQQTTERMTGADLPAGVQPSLGALTTAIGEVYRFRLVGEGYDSRQLRTTEDWTVEKHLRQIPGVADVVSMGGQVKQYVVTPNLARLRDTKVSISQIYSALQRANANSGGGIVEQGAQQFLLRGIGLLQSTVDIGDTVVAETHGVPIRIRDVADIEIGSAQRQGIIGQDGDDEQRRGERGQRLLGEFLGGLGPLGLVALGE